MKDQIHTIQNQTPIGKPSEPVPEIEFLGNIKEATVEDTRPKFSEVQLREALLHIEDAFDRVQVPFILLKDTARCMKDYGTVYDVDSIEVGVTKRHLTVAAKSILLELAKGMEEKGNWLIHEYNGVPISVQVIQNRYNYFDNPDKRSNFLTDFMIPNQWDLYWEERNDIE